MSEAQTYMVQVALHRARSVIMSAPEGITQEIMIVKAVDNLVVELDKIGLKKPLRFLKERIEARKENDTLPPDKIAIMEKAVDNLFSLFKDMLDKTDTAEQSRKALLKKGFNV